MKRKVAELDGALLNAAVAMAEGLHWWENGPPNVPVSTCTTSGGPYEPSADWAVGGPIIERERIATAPIGPADGRAAGVSWCAWVESKNDAELEREDGYFERNVDSEVPGRGLTPLIAAMRAYVASKLGDEIELPGA